MLRTASSNSFRGPVATVGGLAGSLNLATLACRTTPRQRQIRAHATADAAAWCRASQAHAHLVHPIPPRVQHGHSSQLLRAVH